MPNITSATAEISFSVPDLFSQPVRVEGFSATDIFSSQPVTSIETSMGLDGRLSAGWVPVERHFNITLAANSETIDFFDQIDATQRVLRRPFNITGVVILESINKSYELREGYMVSYASLPDAKKTLEPRRFEFRFSDIVPSPVGVG